MQRVIMVKKSNDNKELNKLLSEGYNVVESNPIEGYESDDVGTYSFKGVNYILEKKVT